MPDKKFEKTITFGTAEELEAKRQKDFLLLTPGERFEKFLMMIQESYILFGKKEKESDNFIIRYKDDSGF